MKILIIGSNSKLFLTHHKVPIMKFAKKKNIKVICLRHHQIFKYNFFEYDLCLVYADPKNKEDEYHNFIIKKFNNACLISSSAVFSKEIMYKYVKRKINNEMIYKSNNCGIIRIGNTLKNEKKNVSPFILYSSDKDIVISITDLLKKPYSVVNCFKIIKNKEKSILKSIYIFFDKVSPKRIYLRPFDFILKLTGYSGYGYSFIKDA